MFALPKAISSVGSVPGALFILLFGSASGFGLFLLARCAAHVGRTSSFNALSQITYPKAALFFDLAIAIKCFGVGVSYLILMGDLMPQVMRFLLASQELGKDHWLLQRQIWITIVLGLVTPLSFMRRLDSLKYTSFIALLAIVYLLFLVVYWFFNDQRTAVDPTHVHLWAPSLSIFSQLPVFVFAFTCHQNLFSVYNELRQNTAGRINFVIQQSLLIAVNIYWVVGLLGYYMFGENVLSNMLLSFPQSLVLVTIAQAAITVLTLFSYPLQCHPCRASLDKVLRMISPSLLSSWSFLQSRLFFSQSSNYHSLRSEEEIPQSSSSFSSTTQACCRPSLQVDTKAKPEYQPSSVTAQTLTPSPLSNLPTSLSTRTSSSLQPTEQHQHKPMSTRRFTILTTCILVGSYILALLVKDLSIMLALVGATASTTICYILPGLFYLKLKENDRWTDPIKLGAISMVIAGCIIMPVCVVSTLMDVISQGGHVGGH